MPVCGAYKRKKRTLSRTSLSSLARTVTWQKNQNKRTQLAEGCVIHSINIQSLDLMGRGGGSDTLKYTHMEFYRSWRINTTVHVGDRTRSVRLLWLT